MHQQDLTPIGDSIALSALCALLPLATLLILIGGLKWRAQSAAVAALGVGVVVAVAAFGMPVGQAIDAGALGAALGVLVVLWITFNAIWIYKLTVESGHFAVMRRSFSTISDDQRVQAVVIAFAFGALLEALAGGGAPVAVCAVMLIALGFHPLKAAAVCLLANTAPVAFGGMGNPMTVMEEVTGLPAEDVAAMAGRQVPFLALLVPFALLLLVDGRRGVREAWPVALVGGVTFAIAQFGVSNFGPYRLTDIGAALVSAAAIVAPAARLVPVRSAARRRGRRPAGDRRRRRPGPRARAQGRPPAGVRQPPRRVALLRAVRDRHRDLLDRPDRRGQGVRSSRARGRSRGPGSTSATRAARRSTPSTSSTTWARPARSCSSPASSRRSCCRSPRAARWASTARRSASSAGRS